MTGHDLVALLMFLVLGIFTLAGLIGMAFDLLNDSKED